MDSLLTVGIFVAFNMVAGRVAQPREHVTHVEVAEFAG
jgi:ABC-type bacteriocin/lantibiotic exporter with double-glycine peptidase domain